MGDTGATTRHLRVQLYLGSLSTVAFALPASWKASGICQGVWMANGLASSLRCMRIGGQFIEHSVDECRVSFFIRKSLYSSKKNSLACAGVVVSLNGSVKSLVGEDEGSWDV